MLSSTIVGSCLTRRCAGWESAAQQYVPMYVGTCEERKSVCQLDLHVETLPERT
jgi:hypothetical protein